MITLDRQLYVETFAPDCALRRAACSPARRSAVAALRAQGASRSAAADWRVLAFFAPSRCCGSATSANGRYGMVVLLLAGVCLARLVERAAAARAPRASRSARCSPCSSAATVVASPPRWFLAEPWTRHWLPYASPERALREPALYLSSRSLPSAVVAPFAPPAIVFRQASRPASASPPDAPRLAALLERHRGRVRVLGRGLGGLADAPSM